MPSSSMLLARRSVWFVGAIATCASARAFGDEPFPDVLIYGNRY
ncbi:MAG TPA: hypothetical protein VEA69_20845 [Tepidisphaeraceae bacterium]|nr:hypothetical protein [Tepidisphaeraceae bacterium]